MIEQITTYYENALDLVISQYSESGHLNSILSIMAGQLQICEEVLMDLLDDRMLDNAAGSQLDGIGRIVNESRNDRSDEDYRYALSHKIAVNKSGGEAEIIIAVCTVLMNPLKLRYRTLHPANITIWTQTSAAEDFTEIAKALAGLCGVGIGFYLRNNIDTPFVVSESTGEQNSDGSGLGEAGETGAGGQLAEVFHGV